ncbi:hypothetical protein KR059_008591 [Drosophila kikkawai]|nr:hypothetical protein KR059_008591 [Drosophila kikkawai]
MISAFQDLYKKGLDAGEQQKQRQRELLEQQKLRRHQEQDVTRPLVQKSPKSEAPPKKQQKRKQRAGGANAQHQRCPFRPQLSEWLRQKPEDLDAWQLVPCPAGARCLVVAKGGRTRAYYKSGWQFDDFRSSLPGDRLLQRSQTVLDCIYVKETDSFYVLDAITFGQQDLQECEATFRFYWLKARFEENDYASLSEHNEKSFFLLDHHNFEDTSAVEETLQKYPLWEENKPALDGFLFYHKEASYVCGSTPLVCWLFPFMLPDMLGLPVSGSYTAPEDYQATQPLQYMEEFDRKLKEKVEARLKKKKERKAAPEEEKMEAQAEEEAEDSDEYAALKGLLDQQRRLELGELDMDCEEEVEELPSAVANC